MESKSSFDNECKRSVIENGIALDSRNGAVWFSFALYELNENDVERATEALLEASSAPAYEKCFGEYLSIFELKFSQMDPVAT